MANSVRVSEKQLPGLHESLTDACHVLGLKIVPDLYVKQNPVPNAYTMAINGEKPFIVVHSSLLDMCTPQEAQAVLAHELGHLLCEHGIWLSLANIATLGLGVLAGPLGAALDAAAEAALLDWSRSAEYSCDRAALLVAQNPAVVASALLKLTGGSGLTKMEGGGVSGEADQLPGQQSGELLASQGLSVEAFLEQAAAYDAALKGASPAVRASAMASTGSRTHPIPVLRVAELDRWAKGPEYNGILKRGRVVCSF